MWGFALSTFISCTLCPATLASLLFLENPASGPLPMPSLYSGMFSPHFHFLSIFTESPFPITKSASLPSTCHAPFLLYFSPKHLALSYYVFHLPIVQFFSTPTRQFQGSEHSVLLAHDECLVPRMGFPGGTMVKSPSANTEDTAETGLIPAWGRSPGEGNGNPLQCWCLKHSMDRGA